ncbi:hypothetical protein [Neptuniibacter sp. QD37_11]|uniref:hypothetical protein n=1 Tax=Neptuniibacter sp. QD37_11 TaxID=3398209 RepID=UPI0039F5CC98
MSFYDSPVSPTRGEFQEAVAEFQHQLEENTEFNHQLDEEELLDLVARTCFRQKAGFKIIQQIWQRTELGDFMFLKGISPILYVVLDSNFNAWLYSGEVTDSDTPFNLLDAIPTANPDVLASQGLYFHPIGDWQNLPLKKYYQPIVGHLFHDGVSDTEWFNKHSIFRLLQNQRYLRSAEHIDFQEHGSSSGNACVLRFELRSEYQNQCVRLVREFGSGPEESEADLNMLTGEVKSTLPDLKMAKYVDTVHYEDLRSDLKLSFRVREHLRQGDQVFEKAISEADLITLQDKLSKKF